MKDIYLSEDLVVAILPLYCLIVNVFNGDVENELFQVHLLFIVQSYHLCTLSHYIFHEL